MIRFGLSIIFLLTVLTGMCFVIYYGESFIFREVLVALPYEVDKYDNQSWVEIFQNWAIWEAILAFVFGLIWLGVGQFYFRIEHYGNAGGFFWWIGLLIFLLLITFISGFILIPGTQENSKPLGILFYLINAFVIYWFSSAVCSPSTVKYAPLFSKTLARPANGIMKTFQGAEK